MNGSRPYFVERRICIAVAIVKRLNDISVAIKARAVRFVGRMSPKSAVANVVILKYIKEKNCVHTLSPTLPLKLEGKNR